MKDYPYFKAYIAEILMDTMRMSQSEKGDYLDNMMVAWKNMDAHLMPSWMREYADETISKSRKLSENSKVRWSNAMQLHTNCNSNAMQNTYIEERRGEDRIGNDRIGEKKKATLSKKELFVSIPESLLLIEGFEESWHEWLAHKIEIKQKMPSTTMKHQLKQLSEMKDPIGSISRSIRGGWKGLFDSVDTNTSLQSNIGYNKPFKSRQTEIQEHNERVCRELDAMYAKPQEQNEIQQCAQIGNFEGED